MIKVGFWSGMTGMPEPIHIKAKKGDVADRVIISINGCVYVNQSFVFVDYMFWLAVVVLASLALSGIVSHKAKATAIRKPVAY